MNSKEALEKLLEMAIENGLWKSGLVEDLENTIKQDLDRLENLEKDYEKLKERYKHRAETSKDLCDATKQYEKAIEILKEKLEITLYSHDEFFNPPMINGTEIFKNLTQEEYELLKEVLGNE